MIFMMNIFFNFNSNGDDLLWWLLFFSWSNFQLRFINNAKLFSWFVNCFHPFILHFSFHLGIILLMSKQDYVGRNIIFFFLNMIQPFIYISEFSVHNFKQHLLRNIQLHLIRNVSPNVLSNVNYDYISSFIGLAAFKSVSTSSVPDHKISKNGLDRSEYWESHVTIF